jgi:hypothetical protein
VHCVCNAKPKETTAETGCSKNLEANPDISNRSRLSVALEFLQKLVDEIDMTQHTLFHVEKFRAAGCTPCSTTFDLSTQAAIPLLHHHHA